MAEIAGVEQDVQGRGQGVSPINKPVASPRGSGLGGVADSIRSGLTDLANTAQNRLMGDDMTSAMNELNKVMLKGNPAVTRQKRIDLQNKFINKHGADSSAQIINTLKGVTSGHTIREQGGRTVVTDVNQNIVATTDDRRTGITKQYSQVVGELQEDAPTYMPHLNNLLTIYESTQGEGVAKNAPSIMAAQTDIIQPFRAVSSIAERMDANVGSVAQFEDRRAQVSAEVSTQAMLGLQNFDSSMIRDALSKQGVAFTPENAIEFARAYKTDFINHVNQAGLSDDMNLPGLNLAMEQQIGIMKGTFDAAAKGDAVALQTEFTLHQMTNGIFNEMAIGMANKTVGIQGAAYAKVGELLTGVVGYVQQLQQSEEFAKNFVPGGNKAVDYIRTFADRDVQHEQQTTNLLTNTDWGNTKSFTQIHNAMLTMGKYGDMLHTKQLMEAIDAKKGTLQRNFVDENAYNVWLANFNRYKININKIKDIEQHHTKMAELSSTFDSAISGQ